MDDRLATISAIVVGAAVIVVGLNEYVLVFETPEPLASGLLVCGVGVLLVFAGGFARSADDVPRSLAVSTGVGLFTLATAVFTPTSLLFGGVFWLALVTFALVAAGVYPTIAIAIGRR